MWVLVQTDAKGKKKKFVTSASYDNIIKYINKFVNVKKYDDYNFISFNDEIIEFKIYLTDHLDRRY